MAGFIPRNRVRRAMRGTIVEYNVKPRGLELDPQLYLNKRATSLQHKIKKKYLKYGGIKFQLGIAIVLGKYNIKDGSYHEITPWFNSEMMTIYDRRSISEKFRIASLQMLSFFDAFLYMGSGWFVVKIDSMRLNIVRSNPWGGKRYKNVKKLPLCLKSRRCLINIPCSNDKCFLYCILEAFIRQNSGIYNFSNRGNWSDKRYENFLFKKNNRKINLNSISFPMKLGDIARFEKDNNISINVFGMMEGEELDSLVPFPMFISTRISNEKMHINLLLYDNHYMLITQLDKFIRPFFWKKARYFCSKCLVSFNRKISLNLHVENNQCTNGDYSGQQLIMPQKNDKIKFTRLVNQIKCPFVIYADFESFIKPHIAAKGKNTKITAKHEMSAFGAIFVSKYSKYTETPYVYVGKNPVKKFVSYLMKRKEKIIHILNNKRRPIPDLTPRDIWHLSKQTKCYLCGVSFDKKGIRRVLDHAHLGKEGILERDLNYACNSCNINVSALNIDNLKIPVIMHNLIGYDSHFLIREASRYVYKEIKVLPLSSEKFFALFIDKFVFMDSFQFLPNSLSNLANLLVAKGQENLKLTANSIEDKSLLPLIVRKGVMCYNYITCFKTLEEKKLPAIECFFNDLTGKDISLDEYQFANEIFRVFKCRNIKDYLILYLKTDVLLLADVFESFRETSLSYYKLDPARYLSAPSLSYDALFKFTGIKLDLLYEVDMYSFIEKGIRGGMTNVSHRYAKVNSENEHIVYYDCNNLYGYAMSLPLPYKDFEWVNPSLYKDFNVLNIGDNDLIGYILEVDLEYPEELHDMHDLYPLAPEKMIINKDEYSSYAEEIQELFKIKSTRTLKLLTTLKSKYHYIVHYRNLKLYLQLGLKLKKIHRILSFRQKPWMKKYIDYNNEKRKQAKSDFEKEFFKLMNNSAFGKCMENTKKRVNMNLVTSSAKCQRLIRRPTFQSVHIFDNEFVGIRYKKSKVYLDKPIYLGFCILELSKCRMYDFHYNHMLKAFDSSDIRLLYTDTDSLIYKIIHTDFVKIIQDKLLLQFDFSSLPQNHPLYNTNNYKVLGKMKDEAAGSRIIEFIALKPKMYSILYEDNRETKKIKGVKKSVTSQVTHNEFRKALFNTEQKHTSFNSIRSFNHEVFTVQNSKLTLSPFDDKRWLFPNGIRSMAYGHKDILSRKERKRSMTSTCDSLQNPLCSPPLKRNRYN